MQSFPRVLAAMAALLFLAGCGSGEPSAADIKAAFQKHLNEFQHFTGTTSNNDFNVEKNDCQKKQNSTGYICSFTTIADGEKTTMELTFLKGPDGWVIGN